jgi:hypothetical protein
MTALILCCLLLLPLGSILLDMDRDDAGLDPLFVGRRRRHEAELARLTAPLPPKRDSLLPIRPQVHQPPRVRPAWDTPTGEFWVIVDRISDLEEPCAHCATPEDGEPAHAGCPGCVCPCALVGVA